LVGGNGCVAPVTTQHIRSLGAKKNERAGQLVGRLALQMQLLLAVVLERRVSPFLIVFGTLYLGQRLAELEPGRLEAAHASDDLGALGIVGVLNFRGRKHVVSLGPLPGAALYTTVLQITHARLQLAVPTA